ncbi:MAG: DNA-processing protein DprA [Synergistaceae bacterium]|nr:DNA-processing protein DprA [Synergistaceae bacterium]
MRRAICFLSVIAINLAPCIVIFWIIAPALSIIASSLNSHETRKIFVDNITKAALLLNAIRVPQKIFARLCSDYDPAELWQTDSLRKELGLSGRMCEKLAEFLSAGWAEREDERIYQFGARFITSQDLDYPARLFDLKKPPVGLYMKGNVNLSLPSVAIVGTRKCSAYAETQAVNLGKALAQVGIMTISGGAKGIDSAGHRGTLSGDGVTVVIFGNGLDRIYPTENRDLFGMILERGAWVSEYPFGTNGDIWRFPERDRVIAAMAAHVVIAESPEDGGAMHTARTAKELGRDTWSLPGRINEAANFGSNKIMNEGVRNLYDIGGFIREITAGHGQAVIDFCGGDDASGHENNAPALNDSEKAVYSLLQRTGAKTDDDIIAQTGLDLMDVNMAIMNLEAEGLISSSGGRYSAL